MNGILTWSHKFYPTLLHLATNTWFHVFCAHGDALNIIPAALIFQKSFYPKQIYISFVIKTFWIMWNTAEMTTFALMVIVSAVYWILMNGQSCLRCLLWKIKREKLWSAKIITMGLLNLILTHHSNLTKYYHVNTPIRFVIP